MNSIYGEDNTDEIKDFVYIICNKIGQVEDEYGENNGFVEL